jgi:hypothetical protein
MDRKNRRTKENSGYLRMILGILGNIQNIIGMFRKK